MVEKLRVAAEEYVVGDLADADTSIGPLTSQTQRQRVDDYIQRGIADGATLADGGPSMPEAFEIGAYAGPTILSDVGSESVIAQEEIFRTEGCAARRSRCSATCPWTTTADSSSYDVRTPRNRCSLRSPVDCVRQGRSVISSSSSQVTVSRLIHPESDHAEQSRLLV
ncbi:3-succinoylsemialdehyde-pyridine dehydrogenase [Streptomyces sp. MBT84]|nr:3-succinoylsemialdehyde-pyridine dehydrogenase [Streptomyces sp. MBT84]